MTAIARLGLALILISSAANAAPPKAPPAPPPPPAAPAPVIASATTVAVIGLRSTLSLEEKKKIDEGQLAEVIREAAERALPGARVLTREELPLVEAGCGLDCQLANARKAGATLVVTGDLLRLERGLLASLELRDPDTGAMLSFESALGGTPAEMLEAVSRASADLFASKQPVEFGIAALPADAQPAELAADPLVLQDYDTALRADERGKENPAEAESAWEKLAARDGKNPYRDEANARAAQWHTWQETRGAFEAQRKSDTENLRKLLPLATTGDTAKLRLLARYAHAYGAEEAKPFIALLPATLTAQAGSIVSCEGGDADQCIALVHLDEAAKDAKGALTHLEIACEAGASPACAEIGERLLAATSREPSRAIPALQRGCAMGNGRACARLARLYEEGDVTDANLAVAAELRSRACNEGDGRSCRKLGCSLEGEDVNEDLAKAVSLWKRGCELGDPLACRMARAASPRRVVKQNGMVQNAPVTRWKMVPVHLGRTSAKRIVGVVLLGGAGLLATVGLSQTERADHHDWMQDGMSAQRAAPYLIGAAASATLGLILLFSPVEEKRVQIGASASPNGVMLSGKFQ
jgi:TPR repeat protein